MTGNISIESDTSKIKIIGTICIGGSMKLNVEIVKAEKPNPVKPLTIEAINITEKTRINS